MRLDEALEENYALQDKIEDDFSLVKDEFGESNESLTTLPTTLPIALLVALHVPSPSPSPSPSITNTGILPRSSQATVSLLPSPVRQQQSPPPAVLPSPPTVRSLLSEMAMRATRILSSSGETQKQSTITPHARPDMAKQA
ncbi:hypothetical protein LWI29_007425 [Acer saccharum]|uniref:Uncharacterized protein n=1 Tax=Acer saccharum TaxID=4024 RepID=A0AA39TDT6_ACESA|nr:hypothetical protein LWI29_007425 [Acer saccharum]